MIEDDNFARANYEPTASEMKEFIEMWENAEGNGAIRIVPGLLRCLKFVEEVEFYGAHVRDDGTVEIRWRARA